jgi:acetolactate synthase-1/2/3 large subunit
VRGPSGGGATYLLPGVVEANESSVPLLAVTTDIATTSRGRFTLTELDQQALFRPVTKWNRVLDKASAIPAAVRQAFTQMTTGRPGAVHLGLPYDVQNDPVVGGRDLGRRDAERCRRTAPEQGAVEPRRRCCGPQPAQSSSAAAGLSSRARSASCSRWQSGWARPWPRPSAARAASPRIIRSPSASSAVMAARPRRAPSSPPPILSFSWAAAPARSQQNAGATRRRARRSSTSTSIPP